MVREIGEEVGLAVRVIHILPSLLHSYAHGTVRLHPCVCERIDDSGEPQPLHVTEARWIGLRELPEFEFPEANGEMFARLIGWLEGGG